MSDNPWGATTWNPKSQVSYEATHGRARAEARARDAGTYYGGPSPAALARQRAAVTAAQALRVDTVAAPVVVGRAFAKAAVIRPGSVAIYELGEEPAIEDDNRSGD